MQSANVKSVGIIGAGGIGQAMARIARRAGRPVMIANRKGPQSADLTGAGARRRGVGRDGR
ncbi:NAD(P)-dependent oxidoreductase [Candidatus Solirubrobacter pratensis]|uniref:NAD(P)-dependent oxidoreductase n=1 Tax=Candidatus Solirubrobacter pratensis TaxID=1298857 RepID=UPI0018CB0258